MEINLVIELGGSYISIYKKNAGLIFREASLLAAKMTNGEYEIKSFGDNAKTLASIEDPNLNIFSPFAGGKIKSYDYAHILLSLVMKKANLKENLFPYQAILMTTCGLNTQDRDEFKKLLKSCGIHAKYFVPSVFGLANENGQLENMSTNMLVCDIGSQKTDVAVLNKNGILYGSSISLGGKAMTIGVMNMLEETHHFQVSLFVSERIKEELASLVSYDNSTIDVKGFDLHSKEEKVMTIKAQDVREVLIPYFEEIVKQITGILNMCSDEVLKHIKMNGFLIGGQVAKTIGIEQYFKNHLTLMTTCASQQDVGAILKIKKIMKNKSLLQKISYE